MADKKVVLKELIETGKRNSKLTTKEINDALEEINFDVEQVDKLYETLESYNIEIVDELDPELDTQLTEKTIDDFEIYDVVEFRWNEDRGAWVQYDHR